MANIHILDNGNPFNNGVMAMALGFRDGLASTCGCGHSVTVVLNHPQAFSQSEHRFRQYNLSSIRNGQARWAYGPPKCGRFLSSLIPITGRLWAWGQRNGVKLAHLGGWTPSSADIVVSLCGEDYFSDNWPVSLCRFVDTQYLLLEHLRIPHVILAQTFGPFERSTSRKLAEAHLSRAALVTARDDVSFANVTNGLGISGHVHRAGDLAFLMQPDAWDDVEARHEELRSLSFANAHWLGVSVSRLFGRSVFESLPSRSDRLEAFLTQFAAGLDAILEEHDIRLLFTPHVTGHGNDDRDAAQDVMRRMKNFDRVVTLQDEYTAPEIKAVIGRCHAFLGCRMHALIAALSQSVPTLPLAYSPKTLDVIGRNLDIAVMDLRKMEPTVAGIELARAFSKLWAERESAIPRLRQQLAKTTVMSYHNFDLLRPLLLGLKDVHLEVSCESQVTALRAAKEP